MKKVFNIVSIIIILLVLLVVIKVSFFNKKMNKQDVVELFNMSNSYNNLYIATKIEDQDGNVTNIENLRKDSVELYKFKSDENEIIVWTDNDKNEVIKIDVKSKTYEINGDNGNKKVDYSDLNYNYNFIGYENYENTKCIVAEFTYENISKDKIWVDTNTGIILKRERKINDYKYTEYNQVSFDTIKDEDIIKPDLSGFALVKENSTNEEVDNIPGVRKKINFNEIYQ